MLDQAGFTIIECERSDELLAAVREKRADIVIVAASAAGVADACYDLLQRRPDVKLLTIASGSGHADLFELRLLGVNVGAQGVIGALRAVSVGRDEPPADAMPTASIRPNGGRE